MWHGQALHGGFYALNYGYVTSLNGLGPKKVAGKQRNEEVTNA